MQTVSLPISVACYLYFTVPRVLKWVKKSLFHRQDSAEITGWDRRKSRIGLVLVRSRYSTEQKWKIESKLHVFFSILEESTAQNLFCQALMSQLHFGHGPLQRPFHCSVKEPPSLRVIDQLLFIKKQSYKEKVFSERWDRVWPPETHSSRSILSSRVNKSAQASARTQRGAMSSIFCRLLFQPGWLQLKVLQATRAIHKNFSEGTTCSSLGGHSTGKQWAGFAISETEALFDFQLRCISLHILSIFLVLVRMMRNKEKARK